jgi:hypothetical protein
MIGDDQALSGQALKGCCAELYSSEGIRLLLGDSLRPGGLALTARVAALVGLTRAERVLDVAAGLGTTALYLGKTIGCRVEALDLSITSLGRARAKLAGQDGAVRFLVGDAEALPYRDRAFDAVFSECAFSTFPNKARAAREIFRVLRPGGRLGFTDMAVEPGALPAGLHGVLLRVACLADARTVEGYQSVLREAGFDGFRVEEHPEALVTLLAQVRARLELVRLVSPAGLLPAPGRELDLDAVGGILDQLDTLVREGRVGYVSLVAERRRQNSSHRAV